MIKVKNNEKGSDKNAMQETESHLSFSYKIEILIPFLTFDESKTKICAQTNTIQIVSYNKLQTQ